MINWDHVDGVITNLTYNEEALRFKTIAEFKDCVERGAEIVIEWKDIKYGIFWDHTKNCHYICEEPIIYYDTPDELLEHRLGDDRLGDVITQVCVIERTF